MKSFLKLLVLLPIVVIVTIFAIANRELVQVTVDPFGWFDMPAVGVPLFLVLFLSCALGVVLGGTAVWIGQGRHRRAARLNAKAAARHKAELDRVAAGTTGHALTAPSTIR
jgi:uncharacterized integral membrane protein